MSKKISTENIILKAYNNQDRLTILKYSLEEYKKRYSIASTSKIIQLKKTGNNKKMIEEKEEIIKRNLEIIDTFIERLNKLNDNSEKDAKINEVRRNLNKTISNSKTLPYFINNSFKTRKTVAHYVRNSNIQINARNSNLQTNINKLKTNNGTRFKFEEQIENIENQQELIEKLGINKIKRLHTYENVQYKYSNRMDNKNREIILGLLLEYFIKTDEIIDPEYNIENNITLGENDYKVQKSALKLRKKNNILLKITEQLLLLNSDVNMYPPNSLKPIASGAFGKVYLINGNIYKYEHMRFKKISENFLKGRESIKNKFKVSYLYNNYVPATILFGVLLQNFLYKIDDRYVSEILNFSICYEKDIALTVMKPAFKDKNNTLLDFIIDKVDKPTYIIDLINIIIELCKILEIYQNKCCFIHRDLHADNIIINYQYSEDGILNFKLKFIDISSVSSAIIKYEGNYLVFKQLDIWYTKTPESINPFLSGMWNKYDLLYFVLNILFFDERTSIKKNLPIKNENFIKFIRLLLDIFNIADNYKSIVNTANIREHEYHGKIKPFRIKFYSVISKKSEREKLFKTKNKDTYKIFIPSFLKGYLESIKNTEMIRSFSGDSSLFSGTYVKENKLN